MIGRSVLRDRDFRLLLVGQTTSQFGTQVSSLAIPLLAVGVLHASAFQIGLVNAASTVAFLVIGLPVGVWTDRGSRRRFLVLSDIARLILFASIPVAAWLGRITLVHLVVVALMAGAARVFFDIGYQSYIPSVIGRDRVLAGNSAMEFLRSTGQFAGPALGGLLVSAVGAATVVAIDAVSFGVSAVMLLAIGIREIPSAVAPTMRLRDDVSAGVAEVLRRPVLRAVGAASALSNFGFAAASAVNVIFMARVLHLSPAKIGLIISGGAVAVMAGSALTPQLSRIVGGNRIIWLVLAVTAPITVLGALAQPGPLVVLLVLGIAAGEFGQIVYAITSLSLRQRVTPELLLGRVNATMRVIIMGLFPVGALLGGIVGDWLGARATLLLVGLVSCLCPLLLYPALRHQEDDQQAAR